MDGILHDRKVAGPTPRDSSGSAPFSQNNRRRPSRSSSVGNIAAGHSSSSSGDIAARHSSSSGNITAQYSSNSNLLGAQHGGSSSISSNVAAQQSSSRSSTNITERSRPKKDGYFFQRLRSASPNSAPSTTSDFLDYSAEPAEGQDNPPGGKEDPPGRNPALGSQSHYASTGHLSLSAMPAEATDGATPLAAPDERTRLLRPVSSMLSLPPALTGLKKGKSEQPRQLPRVSKASARAAAAAAAEGAAAERTLLAESTQAAPTTPAAPTSYRERRRPAVAAAPAAYRDRDGPLGEIKMELKGVKTGRGGASARRRFPPVGAGNTGAGAAGGSSVAVGFSRRKAPIAPALRYLMEVMCTDLVACGECFMPDDRAGQTLVRFCGFVPIEVDEALDWETSHFLGDDHDEAYGRGVGLPGIAWAASKPRVVEISTLTTDLSFDGGGKRLFHAGRLFHTAMTVPLYSKDGIQLWGVGIRQLMGVVVVYFPGPENHASALITYASAVAASASSMSELMVHRSLFVEGRANRVKRNWRVMRIAIRFAIPMFIKYYKLTGKTVVDGVRIDRMESGDSTTTLVSTTSFTPTAFRAPRYKLSIEKSQRAAIVPGGVIPAGAVAVLASRRNNKSDGLKGGPGAWFAQYLAKAKGGPVHMPEPANRGDAFVTWGGTFISIGLLESVFNLMNGDIHWRGQEDMFVLSGSFGALSTLMFALPAVPLAQPRVIISAHTLAMSVSMIAVSLFEKQKLVWLQKALTVSTVILGMSMMGTVHPPAGALCLVFIGAHNQEGGNDDRMLILVLSVIIGLAVHITVGILVNNLSPRRGYPVFW